MRSSTYTVRIVVSMGSRMRATARHAESFGGGRLRHYRTQVCLFITVPHCCTYLWGTWLSVAGPRLFGCILEICVRFPKYTYRSRTVPCDCEYRYYCKRCTEAIQTKEKEERTAVTFNAWDAAGLAKMDDFVSMELPSVLTKKAAICNSLVYRMLDYLWEGNDFAATSKSLEKAYSATYMKRLRRYVSLGNRRGAQP